MTDYRYSGLRAAGCRVTVQPLDASAPAQPLAPRLDLACHSPDGFEWGYGGSGPAQLALALLAHHCADDHRAERWHQAFKWAVVAQLPAAAWTLTSADIDAALALVEAESANGYRR